MEQYKFPVMPGIGYGKPAFRRAESLGYGLKSEFEPVERMVENLADLVKRILAEDPPPWTVFPDPPCESLDAFLTICCGIGESDMANVLHAFGHHELCDTDC
jgi:hypothetical protein